MKALLATLWITALMALFIFAVMMAGCSPLSPALIEALAKDNASFCLSSDVRGGAGAVIGAAGAYGQATLNFCRSNAPNTTVTLSNDGSITITHGGD